MEKYLKRKEPSSSDGIGVQSSYKNVANNKKPPQISTPIMPKLVDLDNLSWDPIDRIRILEYHPNQRDEIRKKYWVNGPCQPRGHKFPIRMIGNKGRRFCVEWYGKYGNWLEYSVKADKAFCLCCYLCGDYVGNQGGGDSFTLKGFNCWNKTESLAKHVGEINSYHNRALKSCEDLVNPKQYIEVAFHKQDDIVRHANRIRLNATICTCRFCLKCALAFRGHDETETSLFKGSFLETMDLILSQNEELRNLPKAAGNNQYRAPSIQKNIATCFEIEKERVRKGIRGGLIETGSGLNQELSFVRPGDTRWNSHYTTLCRLVVMFPSIIKVLDYVKKEGANGSNQNQASGLLKYLKSFDCVFLLHLMLRILGIMNILSQALQRKNQDIVEAVSLVTSTKEKLQELRQHGFALIIEKVLTFCGEHGIPLLDMKGTCVNSKRKRDNITNRHHYEVDCFNTIMDKIIIEFCDRFSEVSTNLLENMMALSPCKSFSKFDISKLMSLSELYPYDFDSVERRKLEDELDFYHHNVRKNESFANLKSITDLARVMVETNKHKSYPLVYRLLKLALVLPVVTATVERCFSAMKLVKTDLRNRIGDEFLSACLTCTIEKEALVNVKNEKVIERFGKMCTRKGKL